MTAQDDRDGARAEAADDTSTLIARVREQVQQGKGELPARAGAGEIAAAERELGFPLPPLLARLYQEVANGGFGPDCFLFPLIGKGADGGRRVPPLRIPAVGPVADPGLGLRHVRRGDCQDPEAPVLLFEPNADPDDRAEAWFTDSPSLAKWSRSWVDGTGWWEEEVMPAADAPEPQPWPDAARRFSS